ncbi:MAG: helix-turn-helix domain-containing protein [Acidimicrobiales bacterium]
MTVTTTATSEPELPHLLTIPQVAEYLGVNERHIRRLVHERRVPFIKWGHLIRFEPKEIAAWLNGYRRPPAS